MQHKKQLGANKFISKVRVFKPDVGSLPYILFYVETPAPPKPPPGSQARGMLSKMAHGSREKRSETMEAHVVKRSKDGMNVLREYVFRFHI